MAKLSTNPFNITKAVDYTDEQLYEFWVDFPSDSGFNEIIKPTSDMPMIIRGSKGSGKTHVMKHFSFSSQYFRWKEKLIEGINIDGYLGTYLRCSGLNAFKFNDKDEGQEIWQKVFSYYLELWLSQLLLKNIIKILEDELLVVKNEHIIVLEILDLLDKDEVINVKSFTQLVKYFNDLQKNIDYCINNKAFIKKNVSESVEILASPGSLIFGIPEILNSNIKEFENIKFLYLLDEYENFTIEQQKYFNTLIRERKNPTCFKIGARRYGVRTYETLSAGEDIKEGSEFEAIDIDSIFRDNKEVYKKFITNICLKRLKLADKKHVDKDLSKYFEIFDESAFLKRIQTKKRGHLNELNRRLLTLKFPVNVNNQIIENLTFEKNILLERVNILLFYREWRKGKDLVKSSEQISIGCLRYFQNKVENDHYKIIDKFKYDLLDSLARENSEKIYTSVGFENIVKISNGIPRHFLIIMKHIFKWNDYYEITTFSSNSPKIPYETQLKAIKETNKWFIEDARIPGSYGTRVKDSIDRLCDYLRELRFSDIPPECSISTFSIKTKYLPQEIHEIIIFLEQYSYIIEVPDRRDKNSNSTYKTYQLNGLLAVDWELSLNRRGIVDLNIDVIRAIFNPKDQNEFKTLLQSENARHNWPFKSNISPTLFELD